MTGQLSVRLRLRRKGFVFEGSVTLIQRLCLFRVCDNIVDATNLNDYVRELSLHFVVKLTAVNSVSAHSQNGGDA